MQSPLFSASDIEPHLRLENIRTRVVPTALCRESETLSRCGDQSAPLCVAFHVPSPALDINLNALFRLCCCIELQAVERKRNAAGLTGKYEHSSQDGLLRHTCWRRNCASGLPEAQCIVGDEEYCNWPWLYRLASVPERDLQEEECPWDVFHDAPDRNVPTAEHGGG